jgi:hypothetical protein
MTSHVLGRACAAWPPGHVGGRSPPDKVTPAGDRAARAWAITRRAQRTHRRQADRQQRDQGRQADRASRADRTGRARAPVQEREVMAGDG